MSEHTPTPWHLFTNRHRDLASRDWGCIDAKRHPAGGAGTTPAGMTITWCGEDGKANAELIVRAVNSYDALVAACEAARNLCNDIDRAPIDMDVIYKITAEQVLNLSEFALAKAREGAGS